MNRYLPTQIEELTEILKNDGVISVPTDTVYGVCARMTSSHAQDRLRAVKNRPMDKAFPIMCKDLEQVKQIAHVSEKAEKVIRAYMPGPLTIILKKRDHIPAYVNGDMETLAIRIAMTDALYALIDHLGEPIFLTSANQSGQPTARNLDEIEQSCPLLDGMMVGETSFGQASTIVDCSGQSLQVLREGPVSKEELLSVWEK